MAISVSDITANDVFCSRVYEHPCFQADWVAQFKIPRGLDSACVNILGGFVGLIQAWRRGITHDNITKRTET